MESFNFNDLYEMADLIHSCRCLIRSASGVIFNLDNFPGCTPLVQSAKRDLAEKLDSIMSVLISSEKELFDSARKLQSKSDKNGKVS